MDDLGNPEKYKDQIVSNSDGTSFLSTKDENGKYYWKKIKLMDSAIEYYKQLPNYKKPLYDTDFILSNIEPLTKELKKTGVDLFYIKWNKSSPTIFEQEDIEELIHNLIRDGTQNSDKWWKIVANNAVFDRIIYHILTKFITILTVKLKIIYILIQSIKKEFYILIMVYQKILLMMLIKY